MSGFGTSPYGGDTFAGSGGVSIPTEFLTSGATGASAGANTTIYYQLLSNSTAAETMSANDIAALLGRVLAVDTMITSGTLFNALADAAGSSDAMRAAFETILADEADASGALDTVLKRREALLALALASDPLLTSHQANVSLLAELLALDFLALGYNAEDLGANADATDTMNTHLQAFAAMVAAGNAVAALSDSLIAVAILADSADAQAAMNTQATLLGLLESDGQAAIRLRIAGEDYTAWVMNLDTVGVTQYTNYGFDSFAHFNGRYYGAREDGLYLLEGDDDAGAAIDAWVRTGLMNFGTGSVKRLPTFYLGYTATGGMVLKVVVTNDGVKNEHWYRLEGRTANATREDRTNPGKGLASVYWQFELRNIDGGDFDIDTMRFWPMVLTRRVR